MILEDDMEDPVATSTRSDITIITRWRNGVDDDGCGDSAEDVRRGGRGARY